MKRILQLSLFLFITSSFAQKSTNGQLVKSTEIQNIVTELPERFSIEKDGQRHWKPFLRYIDNIQVHSITYKSDGLNVNGFLVQPKKRGTYPCIIWNRGGNQEFGALNLFTAAAMLGKLASKGYVVIATQYRGNGGSEGKEQFGGSEINDVLNLIHTLEEVPAADTSRIGMFGGSRGGMMTYQALTKTKRLKAVAVLGAVADHHASIKDRPGMEEILYELVPNYENNKQAELDKRSAIKWVDKFPTDVPILLMHGGSDWRVKQAQSLLLALELDKYRIPYRLTVFEGGDHGLSEYRTEFYQNLTNWFDKYVKNEAPLPNMEYHGR